MQGNKNRDVKNVLVLNWLKRKTEKSLGILAGDLYADESADLIAVEGIWQGMQTRK